MADPSRPTGEYSAGAAGDENRLKYAYDDGFIPENLPPDEDSTVSPGSASDSEPECPDGIAVNLAASLRLFCDSMRTIEQVEMEMAKAREASRVEVERRRGELDLELTRMVAQSQLQIAAVVAAGKSGRCRKRKRGGGEDSDTPSVSARREGAVLLTLLQSNLFM
ncbi:hypothetical protein CDL15_Pgr012854 [Punica granatum]|nr:hypothetical protein CDL15_Pgr012854 [Punica granatum]